MKIAAMAASVVLLTATYTGLGAAEDTQAALSQVQAMNNKVEGFQTDVEARHKQGPDEVVVTSTLTVSKKYGWKWVTHSAPGGEQIIINNFKTSYHYFPQVKKAIKMEADRPEIEQDFRKPVEEMNLLSVLDPKSIKLVGSEQIDAVPVYHFQGTTTTQFLERGKPVTIQMESWVAKSDGLPRKTVERMDSSEMTTLYRNLKVNPGLKASDFTFAPPEGVEVIDGNAAMRRQREQMTSPTARRKVPRPEQRTTSATQQAPEKP